MQDNQVDSIPASKSRRTSKWVNIARNTLFNSLTFMSLEYMASSWLRTITPERVYEEIENDQPIILSEEQLQWMPGIYRSFIADSDAVNLDYLGEWLRRKFPNIYSVIKTHPDGENWARRRLAEIERQLQ